MKKNLLSCLFFIVFILATTGILPSKAFAQICGPVNITQEPNQILKTTQRPKITVTAGIDCFVTNVDYKFAVWFENGEIDSILLAAPSGKIQDKKTFVAEWDMSNTIGGKSVGTWHFSLWQGKEKGDRQPNRTIVTQYDFTITYPGSNPSIKPSQPAYQVGSSVAFDITGAQTGQDYTFWWDGDQDARAEINASSPAFKLGPVPPKNNDPGTAKFCMYPGGVNAHKVVGVSCEFSTSVAFTSGPPPSGGGASGGGFGPVTPQNFVTNCLGGKQGINTAVGCIPIEDANSFAGWFLKWAIGIAGGIAFLMLIFSGFQIMTSSNNPQQLQTGRELLTAAVSGLILIVFSAFLLKLIGVDILGIPGLGK